MLDRAKLGVPKLSEAHNFFYVVDRTNMKIDMQKNKIKLKPGNSKLCNPMASDIQTVAQTSHLLIAIT